MALHICGFWLQSKDLQFWNGLNFPLTPYNTPFTHASPTVPINTPHIKTHPPHCRFLINYLHYHIKLYIFLNFSSFKRISLITFNTFFKLTNTLTINSSEQKILISNCALLGADLFLYSYELDFLQSCELRNKLKRPDLLILHTDKLTMFPSLIILNLETASVIYCWYGPSQWFPLCGFYPGFDIC